MRYAKRFFITWERRISHNYLMNDALELAKRMRRRGHTVRVHQGDSGRGDSHGPRVHHGFKV